MLKWQKILPNIVSSSFAVILAGKHQRYHLQQGHGVPSKVEGGGGGHCDPACTFQLGKAQKLGFSCFSEQIPAKIFCTHFDHKNSENSLILMILTIFASFDIGYNL